MQRSAVRLAVGGIGVDVPLGTFSSGQVALYDGTQLRGMTTGPGGGDPLFTGTWVAGDKAEWSGTAFAPKFFASGYNSSTVQCNATTFQDVTGHTFSLPRAGEYRFRFVGAYQTNAATTGLVFSAQYSGTTTSYRGSLAVETGAAGGAEAYFTQSTLETIMGSGSGPGGTNQRFDFWGRIVVTTGGTFAFRIASEVAVAAGVILSFGAVSEIWQV